MNSSGLCAFFTVALPACVIKYSIHKMPWTKANAKPVEVEKSSEPEKPVESDEKVDLDEDNDPE